MPPRVTQGAVEKQLRKLTEQLAQGRATGARRLALLRRQAQLGDERDAADLRARRAGQDR